MSPSFIRTDTASVGVVSVEVVTGRGFSLLGHSHPAPHLMFMLGGGFVEDGRMLQRGDARLSPAGDEHFVRGLSSASCLLVSADALDPSITTDVRLTLSASPLAPLADVVAHAVRGGRDGDVLDKALDRLLRATARERVRVEDRTVPSWLRELRARVSHSTDEPTRVHDLARRAGVSREHLTRSFRRAFGTSVSLFLQDVRLARAWRRVIATDWPLADVAFDSGFADQSHLTRQMRSAYGVTPGALRARPASGITFVQDAAAASGDAGSL